MNRSPLHTRNPLGRFSDRADDYARYRPTYPAEAIALILNGLGDPATLVAADIGAGTGISARLLAERGVQVWAVEPNLAMREAAVPHALVQFCDGTAEQTGLPDASVNLITCCQAFHWFNKRVALQEFHRILKPGGRVALMWNERDSTDPFVAEMDEVIRRVADRSVFDNGDRKSANPLAQSTLFSNFREHVLHWQYVLDLDGLKGLVLSSSYVPEEGDGRSKVLMDLETLFHQWAERKEDRLQVSLSYRVLLYLAEG